MSSTLARPAREPVDTEEYLAGVRRLIRRAGERVADGTPDDLVALFALHELVDDALGVGARGLNANGHSWQELGDAMGFTKQAALKRWLHAA